MANHDTHESAGPSESELKHSIEVGHETSDVAVAVIVKWGVGLAVFLIATAIAMVLLFAILQHPPFAPAAIPNMMMTNNGIQPPAGTPILQDNPAGDPRPDNNPRKGIDNIREFRRAEEIRMYEYATQDGKIHIPIDRAMELAVTKLPLQHAGEAPTGVTPTAEMQVHPADRPSSNKPITVPRP